MESPKNILEEFIEYFQNQWFDYFIKNILNLKGVNIKF